MYGTGIHSERNEKCFKNKVFLCLQRILSIVFASLIFLIEEIKNVFRYYKECRVIQSLRKKHDRFQNLSSEEKEDVRLYFNAKICQLDGAQKLICRESSIQVILQLTLIAYQENFLGNIRFFDDKRLKTKSKSCDFSSKKRDIILRKLIFTNFLVIKNC